MTFAPKTYRKGDLVEVAYSPSEANNLEFDGWVVDGTIDTPPFDSRRHITIGEADEIVTGLVNDYVGDNLGTNNATGDTLVRRDGFGATAMAAVYLSAAPQFPDSATRKDYVDGIGSSDIASTNSIVRRDSSGIISGKRFYAEQGPASDIELTRKDYVDGIGTVNPIPGVESVVRRNVAGDAGFHRAYSYGGSPALDPEELTRKDYVDNIGTDSPSPNTVVRRDGSGGFGAAYVWSQSGPNNPEDLTRKDYVDAAVARPVLLAAEDGINTLSIPAGFTTIPIATSQQDTAGGYNNTTGVYVIPETGTYDVLASLRAADFTARAGNENFGVGVDHLDVNDSPYFSWYPVATSMRQGFIYNRSRHFNAGDQVRLFAYADNGGAVAISAASLSIILVRRG